MSITRQEFETLTDAERIRLVEFRTQMSEVSSYIEQNVNNAFSQKELNGSFTSIPSEYMNIVLE